MTTRTPAAARTVAFRRISRSTDARAARISAKAREAPANELSVTKGLFGGPAEEPSPVGRKLRPASFTDLQRPARAFHETIFMTQIEFQHRATEATEKVNRR